MGETPIASVKIVILGEMNVGKTCVINREVGGRPLNAQIWDTAGHERYRSLVPQYCRGAAGGLIVYDITDRESFRDVEFWAEMLKPADSVDVSMVLVGNKADLEGQREVPTSEGEACAERLGIPFFETSAMEGTSVNEAFGKLIDLIVERDPGVFEVKKDGQIVDISEGQPSYWGGYCGWC